MSKTPTRPNISLDTLNLSFKSPKSPAQDLSPVGKRLVTILQRFVENYTAWLTAHRKGISICRSIEKAKCKGFEKKIHFPEELKPLCDDLDFLITHLEEIVKSCEEILKQISALTKLEKEDRPALRNWPMRKIDEFAGEALVAFTEELNNKRLVKENIAFSNSHAELTHMISIWEYKYFVDEKLSLGFSLLNAEIR
ncbi:hypothetical protein DMENIID0001_162370 [Sergentomyia squamirostris]